MNIYFVNMTAQAIFEIKNTLNTLLLNDKYVF